MTPEQLLIIAEECGPRWKVSIRSFAALAAAATAATARIDGIPVHTTTPAARCALEDAIRRLEPLTAKNEEFAVVAGEVLTRMYDSGI